MTGLTKETEQKIRDLGQSLKLQLDFAAAADMTNRDDQLQLAQNNHKTASLMIDIMREMKITAMNDADVLDAIVTATEAAGSKAADVLKAQVSKVRAINDDVRDLAIERAAEKKPVKPEDINRIFKKHLSPT